MATFTNTATLSYGDNSVTSNTVTGELLEVLSGSKIAIMDDYTANDDVTYVITLRNSGATALTNITVTDDLGAYPFGTQTLYPLTYVDGSLNYFVNGVQQAAPAVTAGPPLVFSGITIPAGGNVMLIYEADVNGYAPLALGSSITNTAQADDISVSETITAEERPVLTISKSLSPTVVSENDELTYTFIIENTGNIAADAAAGVALRDIFDPALTLTSVTLNGAPWSAANYSYDAVTGEFATEAGAITVPAATYTQNADGTWTVDPGVTVLTVSGTV